MTRKLQFGAATLIITGLLGCQSAAVEQQAATDAGGPMAPKFEVDPMWPKPLPNHWLLGAVIGVDVDDNDNVWIIHRGG